MKFQIFILIFSFYIFMSTIFIIKPGKNSKQIITVDLDNSSDDVYIEDATD